MSLRLDARTRVPGRAAFTLIEILMVMALIGVLAGFFVSRVNLTAYRVDANVRLVQNALLGAQQTAITKGVPVQVMFDRTTNRIRIVQDMDDDGVTTGDTVIYRALDQAIFLTPTATVDGALAYFVTGTGVTQLTPMQRAVRIAPNGTYGGDMIIYLGTSASRPKDQRAIALTGATGRMTYWSYGSGAWRVRSY